MQKPLLFIVSLCTANWLVAQTTRTGFDDGSVVQTDFVPKLIQANKLLLDPNIPKNLSQSLAISYNPSTFQWNTRKIAHLMPPVGHFEPGLDTSYNPNYVRLGAGNYSHKLLEGYLANRANKKWAYNLAVMHLSADQQNSIRDFSTNKGFLTGARFFGRSSVEMRLSYMRDMNRFFAKDTIYKGDRAETRKIGHNVGFNLLYDLKSNEQKPGFKTGFMFNNFFNNLSQSETEFGINTGWDFNFPHIKTFGEVQISNIKYRQSFTTVNNWFIDVLPRIKYFNKENGVEGTAGLNLTWSFRDTFKPVFYLNPYVYGEKKLEGLKMKVYGGIDGGLRKNSIRRFSETVPFTFDTVKVYNSYEQLKGYAGLKGRITENSQFNVEFGGNTIGDMPLVVVAADSIGALQLVYDEVSNLYFAADIRFSIGEKLRVSASGKINNYSTKTELRAWHLPTETFSVSAAYNINQRLIFSLGVDGQGKRYAKQINGANDLNMKGFADLNLRVDYRLKNIIRFWVQGSNLVNQKYQVWYGYQSYRLNIIGGISASF
ncbi:MAG: hypothetical protein IT244_00050 [Bacteroidia bacterium]|nr:hypothetical protein [Bacteroidia bacterium]